MLKTGKEIYKQLLMKALDIGVGSNRKYSFKTHIPKNYEAYFLDIEKPSKELLKYGYWVVASIEYSFLT